MSSNIIFSFKDNYVDVAVMSKVISSTNIKKVIRLKERSEFISGGQPYANEENLEKVKRLREKFKVINKNVGVILNWENIITRVIETPIMNKKELKNFIDNNIEEYFAVNMNEYCYDYEVMSRDKQNKKGKMSIMLAVVPRIKLKEIMEFIKYCGLIPKSVGIYPNYMSNLFLGENNNSIGVIDINSGKSTLTILDKEKVFLYSSISSEYYEIDEEEFSDISENLDYFLNFYSTRHFGNKVDEINILGEFYNNQNLKNIIKTQTSIEPISGLNNKISKSIRNSTIDGNIYGDILGYIIPVKSIYDKKIDFVNKLYRKENKKSSANKLIAIEVGVLFLVTTIVIISVFVYTKINLSKYNTVDIDAQIAVLSSVQNDLNKLDQETNQYDNKLNDMQKIQSDEFDYIGILDTLRKGLPQEILIKTITIDKNNVNVTFNINNSTMDAAKAVIAINKMNIFEPVELPQINLNDNVKEVTFNLKIIKPYKGVDVSGKK